MFNVICRCIVSAVAVAMLLVLPGFASAAEAPSPLCTAMIKKGEQAVAEQVARRQPLTAALKKEIHEKVAAQVERHQCKQPYFVLENRLYVTSLHKLSGELSRNYQSLLAHLHGAAKAHLVRDEDRWTAYHDREDTNPANVLNQDVARVARLRELSRELSVGPYPFVSDQVIIKNGYFEYGSVHIDARYPQFDNGGADAATTSRFFAESARQAVSEMQEDAAATFGGTQPPGGPVPEYEYAQWFALHRPGPYLLDVHLFTSSYTGGAHANTTDSSYLIDLRTDATVQLEQVFDPAVDWHSRLTQIVATKYAQEYGAVGSRYYGPADIAQELQNPSYYVFRNGSLEILLDYNPPNVRFEVDVPYTEIKSLLRAGGPVMVAQQRGRNRAP
jgi:hypothetical protein